MARSAKTLVKSKGIMSTPNSRPGKTMNEETVKTVKDFLESDSISRLMPGKKDCVSMKVNGHKENVQKRLLLSNLIEAYKQFKTEHPTVKVGFTKFTELRPKNVVLAGASGTHNVCVCTYHQNMKIMIEGSKIATNPDFKKMFDMSAETVITTQHLLAKLSCNPALPECLLGKCSLCAFNTNQNRYCGYCQHQPSSMKDTCPQCKKVSNLKEDIMKIYEHLNIDEISYKAWVSTDRTSLEILTKKVDDFVDTLVKSLETLRRHDFIAKQQSAFLNERKQNLQQGEIIVIGDFSENYSFVLQDAVQGFHWTNDQATLHPFVIYYFGKKRKSEKADNDVTNDEVLKMRCFSFVIISNCMTHDSVAVHYFIKALLRFLKSEISVQKVFYFSDGAASQYKNKKNFINLAYHYHDFHLEAEWHFFATSHGKGPCDGVGGTVKRLAARTSLQRPNDNQIQTPQQLFEWAKEAIPSVKFQYVNEEEIKEEGSLLKQRFDSALPIIGTQAFHAYYPILNSKTKLQVKLYSNAEIKETVKISSTQEFLSIEEIRNYQHAICEYDNQWWLALVIKVFPENDEVEVQFLHPAGPSPSFSFPQKLDNLMVNCRQILMKASPTTETGRVYSISIAESLQASHTLKKYLKP